MLFRSLDLRRHKTQFREHEIIQDRVHDSAVSQEELVDVLCNLLLPHTKQTCQICVILDAVVPFVGEHCWQENKTKPSNERKGLI